MRVLCDAVYISYRKISIFVCTIHEVVATLRKAHRFLVPLSRCYFRVQVRHYGTCGHFEMQNKCSRASIKEII